MGLIHILMEVHGWKICLGGREWRGRRRGRMDEVYDMVKIHDREAFDDIVAFASVFGFPFDLTEKMRAEIEAFCMEQVAKQIAKR
jgi:hypothetical protein